MERTAHTTGFVRIKKKKKKKKRGGGGGEWGWGGEGRDRQKGIITSNRFKQNVLRPLSSKSCSFRGNSQTKKWGEYSMKLCIRIIMADEK